MVIKVMLPADPFDLQRLAVVGVVHLGRCSTMARLNFQHSPPLIDASI
jgi:hypothetical protein